MNTDMMCLLDKDILTGAVLLALSLSFVVMMTLWSRHTIELLSRMENRSLRQVIKDMDDVGKN